MVWSRRWRAFRSFMEVVMASLKDRAGYGDRSQGSHEVEFLPFVADMMGWIGLLICAAGVLLLLGEGLAAVFGYSEPPFVATASS
jgi:hypothetical protein